MAAKHRNNAPYCFAEEFRAFSKTGRFSESFFEKLHRLAQAKIKRKFWRPQQLGIVADCWDEEATHELALQFLTEHLVSNTQARLNYLLDKAATSEVDFLMMDIFDQFLTEMTQRRYPHSANIRKRIEQVLAEMEEQGEIVRLQGSSKVWAPVNCSISQMLEPNDLQEQLAHLPDFTTKHRTRERISSVASEGELRKILRAVFKAIRGQVALKTLSVFVGGLLGVCDVRFENAEGLQFEAEQSDFAIPKELQEAFSCDSEAEGLWQLKQRFARLTQRQKEIFRLRFSEGHSVAEICVILGLGKSVVYDELNEVERILTGQKDFPENG